MRFLIGIGKELFRSRRLVFDLARDDFKLRFAGSGLGAVWGFVQPFVTILLYWFVFQVGFRSGNAGNGMPYILWLIAGIVPWFFFSEAWNGASNCMYEYSFLVKKIVFRIEILPFVKILSALFVHLFFIGLTFVVFALYGHYFKVWQLQILYYLFCEIVLVYAVSLLCSSLAVFVRDVLQLTGIFTQIFFWMIPVVWAPENIQSGTVLFLLKLNPIYYLVEGFRDSMMDQVWFWEKPLHTLYYWLSVAVLTAAGVWVYQRLNRYFADLL